MPAIGVNVHLEVGNARLEEGGPGLGGPLVEVAVGQRDRREAELLRLGLHGLQFLRHVAEFVQVLRRGLDGPRRILAGPNVAEKSWIWTQYDHMVGTNTVERPGGDAAVLRIKGTSKGIAVKSDVNPFFVACDPYRGAAIAVAEAARSIAATGARPLAVTDCLNFGNPERPEIMGQFEAAVRGLSDACRALSVPVVSGNVSFYNETDGRGILPTPTVGMVGLLDDVSCHVRLPFRDAGDAVAHFLRKGGVPEVHARDHARQCGVDGGGALALAAPL